MQISSDLMLEALIERKFPDKITRTNDGVLRTYYAGFDLSELCRVLSRQINESLAKEST